MRYDSPEVQKHVRELLVHRRLRVDRNLKIHRQNGRAVRHKNEHGEWCIDVYCVQVGSIVEVPEWAVIAIWGRM